jgi:hypothetical protein
MLQLSLFSKFKLVKFAIKLFYYDVSIIRVETDQRRMEKLIFY